MSANKRKHVRTKLKADVKVSHPDLGDLDLQTGDISDGGAYILAKGKSLPGIGEQVKVQVQGMGGGDAPALMMKVVRMDKNGFGLEFVSDED